ncbi:MAG TPA: hypothetical protein VJ464_13565 [Blastocatellia bacterium]|nr:hypothetical protein [Blastocatellia bacterium]
MQSLMRVEEERRPSYAELAEMALDCLDVFSQGLVKAILREGRNRNMEKFLRRKRQEWSDAFYRRCWTVEEIKAEQRELARDMETAIVYADQSPRLVPGVSGFPGLQILTPLSGREKRLKELYAEAVRLELIDSYNDLRRKADFLSKELLKLNLVEYIVARTDGSLTSLADNLRLGAEIAASIEGVAGNSPEVLFNKSQRLKEAKERAIELHPESAEEIEALFETERLKLGL